MRWCKSIDTALHGGSHDQLSNSLVLLFIEPLGFYCRRHILEKARLLHTPRIFCWQRGILWMTLDTIFWTDFWNIHVTTPLGILPCPYVLPWKRFLNITLGSTLNIKKGGVKTFYVSSVEKDTFLNGFANVAFLILRIVLYISVNHRHPGSSCPCLLLYLQQLNKKHQEHRYSFLSPLWQSVYTYYMWGIHEHGTSACTYMKKEGSGATSHNEALHKLACKKLRWKMHSIHWSPSLFSSFQLVLACMWCIHIFLVCFGVSMLS